MAKSNMSKLTFAAVAALVSSIAQAEPASFTARVEQAQGIAAASASAPDTASSTTRRGAGEPASFIERIARSQGLAQAGADAERAETRRAIAGEPASFIARVELSQLAASELARARY